MDESFSFSHHLSKIFSIIYHTNESMDSLKPCNVVEEHQRLKCSTAPSTMSNISNCVLNEKLNVKRNFNGRPSSVLCNEMNFDLASEKIDYSNTKSLKTDLSYPIRQCELLFYYLVWITHSLAAFAIAVRASINNRFWLDQWMGPSSYLKGWKVDNSDLEWNLYREAIVKQICAFTIHSLCFHFVLRKFSSIKCSLILLGIWILAHLYLTSINCLLFLGAHIFITTFITYYTRCQWFAWIFCITFVIKATEWAPFSLNATKYYMEFNLYLYTSVQVLNYCIYLSRNKSTRLGVAEILNYMEYLFYPMYSTTLIVLYEDFNRQMITIRSKIKADQECFLYRLRHSVWQAIRLVFWFFVLDLILHICCVNAFMNLPFTMLKSLHNYELSSIAYIAGQLFHLKYVVIFGVPRLFAFVDGLMPPGPPICISRVSKYSQMWRYFDQGLYQFLKNQVYVPLMTIGSSNTGIIMSITKTLAATMVVFLFVLAWHGVSSNLYWVLLSAFELFIERTGNAILNHTKSIQTYFSEGNIVRIKAACMLTTVVPGIFGIFFFLGKNGAGGYIFSEVLMAGLYDIATCSILVGNSGFVLLHLFLLGYCFNHVCLHLEKIIPHLDLSKQKCKNE